jgi:predicted nucleic-acid-binding protein
MIGLDTNILVRYLTQDDPVQSLQARKIMEQQLTEENPGFISIVATVELVLILENAYKFSAREIAAAVERVLQTDVLFVQNEQEVFTAVAKLKEGRGSFADALIAALGSWANCSRTLTFNRKSLRIPGFAMP